MGKLPMGIKLKMKLFLDMDGVIADFVTPTCELHKRPNPYLTGETEYNMCKLFDVTYEDFIRGMEMDFWVDLPKTPFADDVVDLVLSKFDIDDICILTAPTDNAGCIPGKREWIIKHFPQLKNNMIFTGQKQFCAHGNALLIDDHDRNIELFKVNGGKTILFKQPWNSSKFFEDPIPELIKDLNLFEKTHLSGKN